MKKIKVLVVDDSVVVRRILIEALSKDQEIEVVGNAGDPYEARDKIVALNPDVITLDIEMPRMDGLTFLEKLMAHYPIPVVILSSFTATGCEIALKAMQLGAVEVMHKPYGVTENKLHEMMIMLVDKVKAAAQIKNKNIPPLSGKKIEYDLPKEKVSQTSVKIVAIGASTGGTEAIRYIVSQFPKDFPAMLITQHMPEHFTKAFAELLNSASSLEVKEATDGDLVYPGRVLVARGNYHMLLRKKGDVYYVEIKDGPLVCRQKPSVDVLFESVAKCAGKDAVGILLTGMGNDGAQGLLAMKEAGSFTIAQDEASCVVFGMPKEAIKINAAEKILSLEKIPIALVQRILK